MDKIAKVEIRSETKQERKGKEIMKREFIKCSECQREYGVTKYFLNKQGVKGIKIHDYKRAALYYSVKEIETAIAKWNGSLQAKQESLKPENDWKMKQAGDFNKD